MRIGSTIGFTLLVGLAGLPANAAENDCAPLAIETRSDWQPIRIISNKPFVTVRLNDSRPLNFVLDAGAPYTFINKGLAPEIGFAPASDGFKIEDWAPTYEPNACVRVLGVTLPNVRLGEIALDHVSPVEGVHLDGLIGTEFFNQYVVLIDYPRSSIRVYPKDFNYQGDGVILPLTIDRHSFAEIDLLAPDGEYKRGTFLVDTGVRMAFLLNKPFVERHGFTRGVPAVRNLMVGVGVRGETRGDMFILPDVKLESLHVRDVVSVASLDDVVLDPESNEAGILGGDFLRRFRVWFDYPHQRLILESTPELAKPFAYDRSGMFLLSGGENYREIRVRSVAPKSPADLAGIREGDRIVSIDGRMTKRVGLEEARRLFRHDKTRYRLVLDRNGELVRATVVTKDLLETDAATTGEGG